MYDLAWGNLEVTLVYLHSRLDSRLTINRSIVTISSLSISELKIGFLFQPLNNFKGEVKIKLKNIAEYIKDE